MYFHNYRVDGRHVDRGMPSGGRRRRSRFWPGPFIGEVVELDTSDRRVGER
jgi:hypothetical protein